MTFVKQHFTHEKFLTYDCTKFIARIFNKQPTQCSTTILFYSLLVYMYMNIPPTYKFCKCIFVATFSSVCVYGSCSWEISLVEIVAFIVFALVQSSLHCHSVTGRHCCSCAQVWAGYEWHCTNVSKVQKTSVSLIPESHTPDSIVRSFLYTTKENFPKTTSFQVGMNL